MQVEGSPCIREEDLQCAVCLEVLREPVAPSCGHTYCKPCLEAWAKRSDRCPKCDEPLPKALRVNVMLRRMVETYHAQEAARAARQREAEDEEARRKLQEEQQQRKEDEQQRQQLQAARARQREAEDEEARHKLQEWEETRRKWERQQQDEPQRPSHRTDPGRLPPSRTPVF